MLTSAGVHDPSGLQCSRICALARVLAALLQVHSAVAVMHKCQAVVRSLIQDMANGNPNHQCA